MKRLVVFFGLGLLLVLSGCVGQGVVKLVSEGSDQTVSLAALREHAKLAYEQFSPEVINSNLKELAMLFAKVINQDKNLKALIGYEVGKQFDDDYDVLFEKIADITINNHTLRNSLQMATTKGQNIHDLIQPIPYLNIAIPVNFDQWSTYQGAIYVLPLQYGKEDTENHQTIGYDQYGNTKVFDANNPPQEPVLVLGINERMEYLQEKQSASLTNALKSPMTQGTSDGAIYHEEILESVYMNEDLESWDRGRPELYVLVAVGENYIYKKFYYEFADSLKTWIPISEHMFTYNNLPNYMQYCMKLREYDGGQSVSYTIAEEFYYEGLTRRIRATFPVSDQIGEGDDDFGSTLIPFYHLSTGDQIYLAKASVKVGYQIVSQ